MSSSEPSLAAVCREWSLALTNLPSVNGTAEEVRFAEHMLARLRARPAFRDATAWTIPVEADPLGRSVVALLVKGKGRGTVILTGHYDTVPIDDYGDLRSVACDPEKLSAALLARLQRSASTDSEKRALADLESGVFLPGRGLLDMKAGLAAGLAVMEAFAAREVRDGNVLFLAVPDEEAASVGARQLAKSLPAIAAEHGIEPIAAINLDSIADDGDGSAGRMIAQGSVGKLLLTAYVTGVPAHACYPFAGINAGAIAGAIAAEAEWAPELADPAAGASGMPPTLLSMKDSKTHYDVTTPAHVWATWNMLYVAKTPEALLDAFASICRRTTSALAAKLERASSVSIPKIEVLSFAELVARATRRDASAVGSIAAAARSVATAGHNLPEQCRLVTDALWQRSALTGPAVVVGFGSLPYLPVSLGTNEGAQRLAGAVAQARETISRDLGIRIGLSDFFPGISDMSFLGEADLATVPVIAANTPIWGHGIAWPAENAVAGLPTVNAGPWGRDYHTPLERLETGYGFDVLPMLIGHMVDALIAR